jgi:uncharacterized protein YcfL
LNKKKERVTLSTTSIHYSAIITNKAHNKVKKWHEKWYEERGIDQSED